MDGKMIGKPGFYKSGKAPVRPQRNRPKPLTRHWRRSELESPGKNAPLNNLNEFWFNPLGLRSLIMTRSVTMVVEREGDGYVAFCPEIDVATQGDTLAEARANLKEAVELFFETASPAEISDRQHNEVYVGNLEVAIA
jgi:predicted RNase H-like HicB family nuclease